MDRGTRSPARFLAPLALVVVVIVFLAIVTSSGGGGGAGDTGSSATTSATKTSPAPKSHATKTGTTKTTASERVYTVEIGDTLGSIADKTGVPLETIQSLNPDVDPHAMVAGQKIKLK